MTTSSASSDVVRVSGPQGIIGSIPYLLGFHPTESLVMLCLRGERNRLGPVLRVDLPPGGHSARVQLARYLAAQAQQHADSAVLVCFSESPDTAIKRRRDFAHAALIAECIKQIERVGIGVFDAALVRQGRCISYLQHHPGQSGFPLLSEADAGDLARLGSHHAGAGRAVLADREALRRSIAGPIGRGRSAAARQISEARSARFDDEENPDGLLRLLNALQDAHEGVRHGRVQTDQAAGQLVADLDNPQLRDEAIFWALHHLDDALVPMFIGLATWTPDAHCAQVCAVLAVVAYRQGDGALAQVALDRVLEVDPGHRLSGLLLAMMQAGMPPHLLDSMLAEDPADESGGGSGDDIFAACDELSSAGFYEADDDDDWR